MSSFTVPLLKPCLPVAFFIFLLLCRTPLGHGDNLEVRNEALGALKQAAQYFHDQVANHGGYVYYCSEDLKQFWGEGELSRDTVEVQPPGTPSVGLAYLTAYRATRDPYYLDAAKDAAGALLYGQLESGGWTHVIHFKPPEAGRMGRYRNGKGGDRNHSSLDDNQTQSALTFLIQLDAALDFKDPAVHEAVEYGLSALIAAQFPCGAFPQVWTGPAASHPVVNASFPAYDWKTEGRVKNYWDFYTLNDGLAGDVADVLMLAHTVYQDARYLTSLKKLGAFLVLAQMPAPQPAWCQQYNYEMHPMWARKFEPPAIVGSESMDVMNTLIAIAGYTGEKRYLEPIPQALEYFGNQCLLVDGNIARYYELKTNKPLYMTSDYTLTYDDSDAPRHYRWKQSSKLDQIAKAYATAQEGTWKPSSTFRSVHEKDVRSVLAALDDQGRWVSAYDGESLSGHPKIGKGFRYLSSAVFCRNVEILSAFLADQK